MLLLVCSIHEVERDVQGPGSSIGLNNNSSTPKKKGRPVKSPAAGGQGSLTEQGKDDVDVDNEVGGIFSVF